MFGPSGFISVNKNQQPTVENSQQPQQPTKKDEKKASNPNPNVNQPNKKR
jgi:hypothetical protein